MPKLFGINIAGILNKALSPGFFDGELRYGTSPSRDSNDPTNGISFAGTPSSTLKYIINTYTDEEIDNESVLREDRKILVVAESIKPYIVPQVGMKLETPQDHLGSDGIWTIVRVTRDPAHATFVCQGRL